MVAVGRGQGHRKAQGNFGEDRHSHYFDCGTGFTNAYIHIYVKSNSVYPLDVPTSCYFNDTSISIDTKIRKADGVKQA
jgi:hypothetical protein